MGYQSENRTLRCVREVLHGKVNDVMICRDEREQNGVFYTVWRIHNHQTAKQILTLLEEKRRPGQAMIETFSNRDGFFLVLDYEKERYLDDFYMENSRTVEECEMICRSLVVSCMASGLPWPILYLILTQRQIHLNQDREVRLGYTIDLEDLNPNFQEGQCAACCAGILRELLGKKRAVRAVSYRLLTKKIPRNSYDSFQELYTDIRLTSERKKKRGIRQRIRLLMEKYQGSIFRILLVLCVILMILVLVMIISNLVWGEIPLFRLFINPFRQIGTESLVK